MGCGTFARQRAAAHSVPALDGKPQPRMEIHRWQQRSLQLVEKPTLHQATQSLGESVSSSSDVLREGCPGHPYWIYLFIADMLSLQMQEYKTNAKHPTKLCKAISNVVPVQPRKNTLENSRKLCHKEKAQTRENKCKKLIPGPAPWFLVDPSGLLDSLKLEQQSFHSLTARLEGCSSIVAH